MANVNKSTTLYLAAGDVLTVTADATSSGVVTRKSVQPGGQDQSNTAVAASGSENFGAYGQVERFLITANVGTLTYEVASVNGSILSAASVSTLTNKTIDANATGNAISNIDVADLADGTDGELITWGADGVATTVAVGTAGQVLTSSGAGSAPAFAEAPGTAVFAMALPANYTLTASFAKLTLTAGVDPSSLVSGNGITPNIAGIYRVDFSLQLANMPATATSILLQLQLNDSTNVYYREQTTAPSSTRDVMQWSDYCFVEFNGTTDDISIYIAYQGSSGVAINGGNVLYSNFSVTRIGDAP